MENDTREGAQTSETRTVVFSLLSTDNLSGLWQHLQAHLADGADTTAPNAPQLNSLGSFSPPAQTTYQHFQREGKNFPVNITFFSQKSGSTFQILGAVYTDTGSTETTQIQFHLAFTPACSLNMRGGKPNKRGAKTN